MRPLHLFRVALLALVLVPSGAHAATAAHRYLLPDLRQEPIGCAKTPTGDPAKCTAWDVCAQTDPDLTNGLENPCVQSGDIRQVWLRFTSSEGNHGRGPLLVFGHRDPSEPTMHVRQAFQTKVHGPIPGSYAAAQRATTGTIYYEPSHHHWHYLNFARYELRSTDGVTIVKDRKNGFCLGDRYPTADNLQLPYHVALNRPSPESTLHDYLEPNRCGEEHPELTDLSEGISVGWLDDYAYDIDLQYVDVINVPSGTYDLVNMVNADQSLLESDYGNDASSVTISLQWPGGATQPPSPVTAPPTAKLLKSCPGVARCAQPTPLVPPHVKGTARPGSRLRATSGTWGGSPTSFTRRWLRDGHRIPGATGRSYRVRPADAGHRIAVRVIGTTAWGQDAATSRSVRVRRR